MVSHWLVEGAFPGVAVSVSFDCSPAIMAHSRSSAAAPAGAGAYDPDHPVHGRSRRRTSAHSSNGSTSIDQVRACACNQLAHPVPGASPQHELCCPFHGAARYPLECVAGPGVVDEFDEPDINELDEPRAKSRR